MAEAYIRGTALTRLWYTWKSYRLPWRRRYFVGMDLQGNTFWEYRDRIHAHIPRRVIVPREKGLDWVDYARGVSPQWHQWLRATRTTAPTIHEQEADVVRLSVLQRNAQLADARWNAAPSLLKNPAPPHPPPDSTLEQNTKFAADSGLQARPREVGADLGGKSVGRETEARESTGERAYGRAEGKGEGKEGEERKDPWREADSVGGGGAFEPAAWTPGKVVPKKRAEA